jgi:hypothetical protein
MSFEILHIRDADKILKQKKLEKELTLTMEYLNDVLYGSIYRRELLRQALEETGWRESKELNILEGRRYCYKGMRKGVALEGNLSSYEYVQDGLLRLQIGYDKKKIDMGIVMVTAHRSAKSPLGSTRELVLQEIAMLYPTISLPVTIVLFDLGSTQDFIESSQSKDTGVVEAEGSMPVEETGKLETPPPPDDHAEEDQTHYVIHKKKRSYAKSSKQILQDQQAAA